MPLFAHVPHPHIAARTRTDTADRPDPRAGRAAAFNNRLALAVTRGVGTMWCAYVFAALALVSLPAALASGDLLVIVGWAAQTFLQLVLLSVILLGDRISAAHADDRDERTFLDAEAVLHTSLEIQQHLAAQDDALTDALARLGEHSDSLSGLHTRLDSMASTSPVAAVQAPTGTTE
ncbi:hypothetical protein KGQ19_16020 [Catenulispora sp. NL8]|uniref:DUF1003 domain-containing protein n=1 Tax=Catenulispora pinistramenti TaxID=2705254 RepID=A0ABS5KQP7_9ACTN|nr:hypothetical protein [Catenulispora pinistramenti]MBS2548373.1 hypothetical protein [Catenulispora pinistramenti]